MSADIFSYSNIGNREINQDYYGVASGERCVAVLCDGLGGHGGGEVASKVATETLIGSLGSLGTVNIETIDEALLKANMEVIKKQYDDPLLSKMRTTVVGCILEQGQLYYFNSGDSRFYLFRNGTLMYMTKDHSVSQMSVELGQMSFADIRHDADRSKLLKVLGDKASHDVYSIYDPVTIQPGDAFLLCSDGFWEYVLEGEMEADLSKSATSEEWVRFMLVRLLLRMNGNNDNFTVVGGIIN